MSTQTERAILKHVKTFATQLGLRTLRISFRPGVEVGWPDTLVFGPGKVLGIETKRPGKSATPIQIERGKTMVMYGQCWAKCDSKEDVEFTLINFANLCISEPAMSRELFERVKAS